MNGERLVGIGESKDHGERVARSREVEGHRGGTNGKKPGREFNNGISKAGDS